MSFFSRLLFFLFVPVMFAQDASEVDSGVIAGTGAESLSIDPIPMEEAGLAGEAAAEVTEISLETVPVTPRSLSFHTSIGAIYDDNIYQTSTETTEDMIFLLSAGLIWTPRLTEKSAFSAKYTATAFHYLDEDELGGDVNHDAGVDARFLWGATTFTGNVGYRRLSGSDLSFGGGAGRSQPLVSNPEDRSVSPQETRDLLSVNAGLLRPLAGKSSLGAGVAYRADLYGDDRPSTSDLSGKLWLGYLVTAKTTVGVAGVVGRTDGDTGVLEETYQQALVTASYDATDKLDFSGSVGVEFRQADSGDSDADNTDFTFNVSARYQWRERTGFYLTAGRNTLSSATDLGSANNRTSVYLGVNQKIGERWTLDVAGGYDFSDYQQASADYATVREENFWTGRVNLNYQMQTRATLGLFYEYLRNDSDSEAESYEANRVGLQIGLAF